MSHGHVRILREYAEGHSFLLATQSTQSRRTPIVYVHGMAGFAGYFTRMMGFITEKTGRTGYAVDIRGHGDHIHEDIRKATLEEYVRDVAHFVKRVVIPKHNKTPILIGHSMGGLITLALAAQGYADRAVLITPAPPKGIDNRLTLMLLPTPVDARNMLRMGIFGTSFRPSGYLLGQMFADPIADAALIAELAEELETKESLTVINELRTNSYPVDWRAVKVPLLVIGARQDVVIHPSVFPTIARLYGAELKVFPNVGHFCPFEKGWEAVAEYIVTWISSRKRWKRT